MTKRKLLLKLNLRLASIDVKRRSEIVNHYSGVIDQSMANGNTEVSSIDSLGDVNWLCLGILKKEKKPIFVPILYMVFDYIKIIIASLVVLGCVAALAGAAGGLAYIGYSFLKMAITSFIPSAHLISANLMGAVFKGGACLIIACIVMILIVFVKAIVVGLVKVVLFIVRKIRDAIYLAQSTKLMKGVFSSEAIK